MDLQDTLPVKRCSKCLNEKAVSEFRPNKRYRDGLFCWCNECMNRENKLWRERNPERAKAIYQRRWANHRDAINQQARERRNRLSPEQRARLAAISRKWYEAHREGARVYHAAYHQAKAPQNRRAYLLLAFGMTLEEYDALAVRQQNLCAICHKPETSTTAKGRVRPLVVDHCHESGLIRGLLCARCNTAIGLLRDDPVVLLSAIDYLLAER